MASDGGRVLYALDGDLCVIKPVGALLYTAGGTAALSHSLDAFLSALESRATCGRYLIDLSDTTAIDSTNLGSLARIAMRQLSRRSPHRAVIYSPHADITRCLEAVCFDRVFAIVTEPVPQDAELRELPPAGAGGDPLSLVVGAHRRLSALDETNAAAFRDSLTLLETEMAQRPD